jgi:integrase
MAKQTLPLTVTQIKNAKINDKKYKLSDGNGLFLLINPNGSKLWKFKYRHLNKEKEYSIGSFPEISLLKAREIREKLRSQVAEGINVAEQKQIDKKSSIIKHSKKENTFYKVSQEWHKNYETEVSENYHIKLDRALENYLYPYIKNKPIEEITRLNIIEILQGLKNKGLIDTASRVFMLLNKIYKYAVTLEYVPHNIIADIEQKNILGKREKQHYPTFTKKEDIKGLILAIDEYSGDYTTKMALKMLPFVFVRSFNIRHCEWSEIDFENKEWIIPASKMKTKSEFILPLSNYVIELLIEVKKFTSDSKYVFPSFRDKNRPLSENTLISALRRMGYKKEEFVPHSFRAMFSTIAYENMNEHQCSGEVIEALLAHKEINKVKEAYNRATYKKGMRSLIEWYEKYLLNL